MIQLSEVTIVCIFKQIILLFNNLSKYMSLETMNSKNETGKVAKNFTRNEDRFRTENHNAARRKDSITQIQKQFRKIQAMHF